MRILGNVSSIATVSIPLPQPLTVIVMGLPGLYTLQKGMIFKSDTDQISLSFGCVETVEWIKSTGSLTEFLYLRC